MSFNRLWPISAFNRHSAYAIRLLCAEGGSKLLHTRTVLTIAAVLLLAVGLACGGTAEQPEMVAPAAPVQPAAATTPPTQPPAAAASGQTAPGAATPAPTVVATATPRPTNTPSAAQQTAAVGGRLRIAVTPPVQELVRGWLGTTTSANAQVRPPHTRG